jgi:hypothetical protein
MDAREDTLLTICTAQAQKAYRDALLVALGTTGLPLLGAIAGVFALWRSGRRKQG